MVAKITIGSSLFGAIKYNADKVNEGKGQLLDTNKIFNDGTGKVDIVQALHDFERHMPMQMRTEKPVIHISLNPHPDDRLTDKELTEMAHEYMQRMGYGDQPYIIVKHEDIDRHHLHIISVRVDEQGKRINSDFTKRRSLNILRDFEQRYNLHRRQKQENRQQNPLHPVNPDTGDIKKQVGNTIKAVFSTYQFQTIGELRALLSLYNLTVDEVRGNAKGEDYNGLVYSVIDKKFIATARSNKVAVCLGFQDFSQLVRDYGDKEAKVVQNTVGNIFSGQVVGETAKTLSERFGKVLQKRQSMSINRQEVSTSINTQMDSLIPPSKISTLTQGMFVGAVSDNFDERIDQKIFHAEIVVDNAKVAKESKAYKPIPVITDFRDENGRSAQRDACQSKNDNMDAMVTCFPR